MFFLKLQHVLHKWSFFLLVKSYSILPASHGKSFVPAFFKVSVDHLFYNLESGKRNYCFGKSLEIWIKNLYEPCTDHRHCVQKCGVDLFNYNQWLTGQCAKKVESDIPGLVYFAIGLVNSVLNLPDVLVKFSGEIQITYRRRLCNQSCWLG